MNVLIPHTRETTKRLLPISFVFCSFTTHLSNDLIFSLMHSSSLTCGHVPLQLMTDSQSLVADLLNRATSVGSSHVSGFILHLELSIQPLRKHRSEGGRIVSFKFLVKWVVGFPQVYGASCASSQGQWLLVLLVLAQHF